MSASSATSWWRSLFGGGESSLRESIEDVLEESQGETADFSDEERHMLKNLLGFRDVRLDDVMVPRADIDAVEVDIKLRDLLALFADCGHSRMPVYRETLDQPIGMVHVKDVLSALQSSLGQGSANLETIELTPLVRPVLFVPPSMPAMELLVKMQATRGHMALVIDEYGGTDGLVTIEDLIEEIVGEIEDEHDEEEELLKALSEDGHWRAQARLPLADMEAALDIRLAHVEGYDDIDTLGGLVFAKAGRVPERGEMIAQDMGDGRVLEFIIHDGDARRIKQVDMRLIARAAKPARSQKSRKGTAD
ncbi:MAG: hemolysin family protein [Alphaproteobacteria bacterium]|jgi:CBS domain containing-hemolysin-like protein|nr:hemolysin family protein [Alphaproteobacteria bacterium]